VTDAILQVVLRRLSRRRKSRESAFVTTLRVYDSGIRVKSKPKRKLDRVTQSFTHIFNHNNKDPANGPELEYEFHSCPRPRASSLTSNPFHSTIEDVEAAAAAPPLRAAADTTTTSGSNAGRRSFSVSSSSSSSTTSSSSVPLLLRHDRIGGVFIPSNQVVSLGSHPAVDSLFAIVVRYDVGYNSILIDAGSAANSVVAASSISRRSSRVYSQNVGEMGANSRFSKSDRNGWNRDNSDYTKLSSSEGGETTHIIHGSSNDADNGKGCSSREPSTTSGLLASDRRHSVASARSTHSSGDHDNNGLTSGAAEVSSRLSNDAGVECDDAEWRYVAHVFLAREHDAADVVQLIRRAFKESDRQNSQSFAVTEDIYME